MTEPLSADTVETVRAAFVSSEIARMSAWTFKGRKSWSVANNGSTIFIVIASAIAAAVSQSHTPILKGWPLVGHVRNGDIATVASLLVTIVTSIQSKIGFERKWIANRLSQSAIQQITIDEKLGHLYTELGEKLKSIIAAHDKAIAG